MRDALERVGAVVAQRFGLLPARRGDGGALVPLVDERRRACGLTLVEYAERIAIDANEQWALASALSNGWTWLFRDRGQLARAVERLEARSAAGPLAIWVAGCSTGEEAYGLAMLAAERGLEVRITATDLSRARLEVAARAIYDEHALRAVSSDERARWLEPLVPGSWRVREELRRAVELRLHNLMDAPPALHRFDAVVCRNVLIHATDDGAMQMVRGLMQALAPGGELVLGASDLMQLPIARAPSHARPAVDRPAAARSLGSSESVDAAALVTVGNLCVEAHEFDRAEAAYRRAEMLDPCSAELHLAWGVLHRKRGDADQAVASLRRSVFLDETLWPAWALLAGALARIGARAESTRASDEARRARRERPSPDWRSHTGRLLLGQLASDPDAPRASEAPAARGPEPRAAAARWGDIDESGDAALRGGE